MKTKNILFLITLSIYCYLFYEQTAGLNFLIFSFILVGLSIWQFPKLRNQFNWLLVSSSVIITALMIVINNSNLAIIAHFISIAMLIGVMYNSAISLYISLIQGILSSFIPFFNNLSEILSEFANPKVEIKKSYFNFRKIKIVIIPFIVTFFFYILYSIANPKFAELIQIPNFRIPFGLISFAFFGSIFISGIFKPYGYEKLTKWDFEKTNLLQRIRIRLNRTFNFLALKTETRIGIVMLAMLNCLILFFIIFDVSFIFSGSILPSGMNHSEYVHQGVNTLIISIILAISIILYFFRANINFYKNNIWLLRLTYLWIIQNGILAMSIVYKNQIYIQENGLTYKRIGVYIYLILTLFGLIITYLKVKNLKSIWYILRKNTIFAFILLVVSSFINWDGFIAYYNINKAKHLDIVYLTNLSEKALPALKGLLDNPKVDLSGKINDIRRKVDYDYNKYPITKKDFIESEIEGYIVAIDNKKWQSYNYSNEKILKAIK